MKYANPPRALVRFLFFTGGVVAIALLISIVNSVPPDQATQGTFWAFYLALTFSLTAILGFVLHGVRRILRQKATVRPHFITSIRQAFLASVMVSLSLFLHTLKLFSLWDALPFLLAFILIEFFFQAEKRPHASISL